MAAQMTFQRYELKYMLSPAQKRAVLQAMDGHMELDQYGRVTIRNIYYDTENFRLIRRSLERPCYKKNAGAQLPPGLSRGAGVCRAEEKVQIRCLQAAAISTRGAGEPEPEPEYPAAGVLADWP